MKKRLAVITLLLCAVVVLCACGRTPAAEASLNCYDVTAVLDMENHTLKCSQRVTYNCPADGLDEICFNLYPAAFREDAAIKPVAETHGDKAYYDGVSYGDIIIENITHNAKTIAYDIKGKDKTLLSVKLPTVRNRGDIVELCLYYTVKLPKTHTRFGITKCGASLCNFYPTLCAYGENGFCEAPYYAVGDPFLSEVADYTVTLFYPSDGLMAATGREVEKHVENGVACSVFSASTVRDFAAVYLENGKVISDRTGGTDINYYYTTDAAPSASLAAGKAAIEVYQKLFGVYPYDVYNVVDTNFIYGGMEYPQLVIINNELTGFNREYTIAHETAHQWWYGMVGSDNVNEAWQDEGLTEFSSALYFKHTGREKLFDAIIASSYDTYLYGTEVLGKTAPFDGVMRRATYDFPSEAAYVITAYDKGMLMNNCLYNLLGESGYLNCCRAYLVDNRYRLASADDYISAFPDCRPLINCWLDGRVRIGAANYT